MVKETDIPFGTIVQKTIVSYLLENSWHEAFEETSNIVTLLEDETVENVPLTPKFIDFNTYFENTKGTAIFLTENDEEYIYNEELTSERYSPFSMFKIVSTSIGLEEGIIETKDSTMEYNG